MSLSAEAKKLIKEHPVMERAAMFMGVVTQKSLLDVITEPEKPVLKDKPVLKEKPKGCHGGCKNFSAAQYGTGSCGLSETPYPVAPDHEGCEDWERVSEAPPKESADEIQLLVEGTRAKTKCLAGIG